MHKDLSHLMEKYEGMARKISTSSSIDNLLNNTDFPNNNEIMMVPLLPTFRVSHLELYDGSRDPVEHLETFKVHMTLHIFPREIACRAFPLTLKSVSKGWFRALQPSSVNSFEELAREFLTQLMASRRRKRLVVYLLTVKQ